MRDSRELGPVLSILQLEEPWRPGLALFLTLPRRITLSIFDDGLGLRGSVEVLGLDRCSDIAPESSRLVRRLLVFGRDDLVGDDRVMSVKEHLLALAL